MGWMRDLLAGYSHGRNVEGQKEINRKLDDISKKVDSMSSSRGAGNGSRQHPIVSMGNPSRDVFANAYNEARARGASKDEAARQASLDEACYRQNRRRK